MEMIFKYVCLGLDYLFSFLLLGLGQIGHILPRCPAEPVIPDTPGFHMVQELRLGWNLGCSLEAFFTDEDGNAETGLHTETMWGNPATTPAVMETLCAAGFRTVRIPVTWANHMDAAGVIDPAWMARVRAVVDYAYDTGLYVILNMHNDDYYNYIPGLAAEAATTAWYCRTWAQIAAEFADYGERLLFEAMNEPKVVGSALEWQGGLYSERQVLNRLNAAFVTTVRAAGGQNPTRWLLLPTYAASYAPLAMRALRLPEDDRLIVSIHAYYPWEYTEASFGEAAAYTDADKAAVTRMLEDIYRVFIAKGIPVYLGEFGAADKNNSADRARYAADYITQAARYGMACGWWDNGLLPEEEAQGRSFALLNRRDCSWYEPEIVAALTAAASSLF
jgi:endoglucanase